MNQQEEAQRIAEEQAIAQQKSEQENIQLMVAELERIDTRILKRDQKRILMSQLLAGGKIAQDASKKIMEILSEKRASEIQKHPTLGIHGQYDKDGKWHTIEVPPKEVAGVPLGTTEYGSEMSNKILASQQITTVPEGTMYIDAKAISDSDGVTRGTHITFLNARKEQIKSEEEKKAENNAVQYLPFDSAKLKEMHPYLDLDLKQGDLVGLNEKGLILGYKLKDDSVKGGYRWLPEGNEILKQMKIEKELAGTENLTPLAFSEDPRFKGLIKPVGTAQITVDKDNNITYLDKDGLKIKGQQLSRINLVDITGKTDDIYSYHVDDATGAIINTIGLAEKYREPVDRLKYNQERADKLVNKKHLDELIDALGKDYGVPERILNSRYRKPALIDPDETFKDVLEHYDSFVEAEEAVQTGEDLNKRDKIAGKSGDFYDNDKRYFKKAGVWEEYTPSSDWRVAGEAGLRKEYNQITRDYRIAARGHDGVMEGLSADNGFGDIMAITSFRIMFEPNSVVREAEFEITSKAGGLIQTWLNKPHQLMEGDRLKPKVRKQMQTLVEAYMKKREKYADRHFNEYRSLAKKNFDTDAGIQHPFRAYKWSKHYDEGVTQTIYSPDGSIDQTSSLDNEDE
tara:strand:- start:632 stop:2512 length:1881 start_codon:yes stop_codon:yes gene_type:complete